MHGGRGELRHHFPVMQDRAGDEVGKVGHEEGEIGRRQALDFAAMHVHQERDLRECKERDAQGKHQSQGGKPGVGQVVGCENEEIGVLEVAKQGEIGPHRRAKAWHGRSPCVAQRQEAACHEIVEGDAPREQRHIAKVPPAVESGRGQRKQQVCLNRRAPGHQVKEQIGRRQESEEESVGVEKHGTPPQVSTRRLRLGRGNLENPEHSKRHVDRHDQNDHQRDAG